MLGTKLTVQTEAKQTFINVKRTSKRTTVLQKAQRSYFPRSGVVLYMDQPASAPPRTKNTGKRLTAKVAEIRRKPMSAYQQQKANLPYIRAAQEAQQNRAAQELRTVEIALLAKIAKGLDEKEKLEQPVDSTNPQSVVEGEERQVDLARITESINQAQQQLRETQKAQERVNNVIEQIRADEIADRQQKAAERQAQLGTEIQQDIALQQASAQNIAMNQQMENERARRIMEQDVERSQALTQRLEKLKLDFQKVQQESKASLGLVQEPAEMSVAEKIQMFDDKASQGSTTPGARRERLESLSEKALDKLLVDAKVKNRTSLGGRRLTRLDKVELAFSSGLG